MRKRAIVALACGLLLALLAIAAARAGAGSERWEYGGLADAIRAGHGMSIQAQDGSWRPSAFVEPFYPALLAGAEALFGERFVVPLFLLQLAALAGAAAMAARVAATRLRIPEGAAFALLTCWPPSLALSLGVNPHAFRLLLLGALLLAADRGRASVLGVLAGACVWVRAVYLVPAVVMGAIALRGRARWVALGCALAVAAPWVARNAWAFGRFVPATTNAGFNLAMGNHPGASGAVSDAAREEATAMWLAEVPNARELDEPAVDASLGNVALEWMGAHPATALGLWARKFGMLLTLRAGAGALYPLLMLVGYMAFAVATTPLIGTGVARAWRGGALLLAPAAALLATFAVFAIDQRYRFEADLLLAPFGLAGVVPFARAWRWMRARARVPGAAQPVVAVIGAVLAVAIGAPLGNPALVAAPLVRRDAPREVDAVFVLSGDVDFHRTASAAREFRERGARWFVVSGAGAGGDNGEEMARAAVADGVPRDAILVETLARTTRENVVFSAPLLAAHGVRSVAVVTSGLHSRRAALAAARAWPGVQIVSRPVPDDDPLECPVSGWEKRTACRSVLRLEWEKLLGYSLRGYL